MSEVSAVLFAKDYAKVTRFYREALGLVQTAGGEDHSVLNGRGFDLIVHQIPEYILDECEPEKAPVRREQNPIRLDFPVDDIGTARSIAASLGGQVDAAPPAWAPAGAKIYLGHDPEGNVFRISQRSPQPRSNG